MQAIGVLHEVVFARSTPLPQWRRTLTDRRGNHWWDEFVSIQDSRGRPSGHPPIDKNVRGTRRGRRRRACGDRSVNRWQKSYSQVAPRSCHTRGMADYRLVLDGLAVFVVDIAATSGRPSMRRFPTEAAALTWIAEQEYRDVAVEPAKGADGNQSSASLS